MTRILIVSSFIVVGLLSSGCATWDGVKKDSNDGWEKTKEVSGDAWNSTKEAVHNATE